MALLFTAKKTKKLNLLFVGVRPISGKTACVVGGGPAGLVAAKELSGVGFHVTGFEARQDFGGLWNIKNDGTAAYPGLVALSSTRVMHFSDHMFPNQNVYSNKLWHPSAEIIVDYFDSYATRFDLRSRFRFGVGVETVKPSGSVKSPKWRVNTTDGRTNEFDYLCLALGKDGIVPDWFHTCDFTGDLVHSQGLRTVNPKDKRVLVIGSKTSGFESASFCARYGATIVDLVYRTPTWVVPPDMKNGASSDAEFGQVHMTRERLAQMVVENSVNLAHFGFKQPKCGLEPIGRSRHFALLVKQGKIRGIHGSVKEIDKSTVHIERNGGEMIAKEYDAIVCATGFRVNVSLLPEREKKIILNQNVCPELYMWSVHPHVQNLGFVGAIPNFGSAFQTCELQARFLADAWSGAFELCSTEEQLCWIDESLKNSDFYTGRSLFFPKVVSELLSAAKRVVPHDVRMAEEGFDIPLFCIRNRLAIRGDDERDELFEERYRVFLEYLREHERLTRGNLKLA